MAALGVTTGTAANTVGRKRKKAYRAILSAGWLDTPAEFSLCPFWFWNDALSKREIARQIEDFRAHGVYGFLIHPRAGLPKSIGWMSRNMIEFMRFAIEQAAKHHMWVLLYDEGMYPSGSSSGQVIKENTAFRTRGLFAIDLDETGPGTKKYDINIGANGEPELTRGRNLVAIIKRRRIPNSDTGAFSWGRM